METRVSSDYIHASAPCSESEADQTDAGSVPTNFHRGRDEGGSPGAFPADADQLGNVLVPVLRAEERIDRTEQAHEGGGAEGRNQVRPLGRLAQHLVAWAPPVDRG